MSQGLRFRKAIQENKPLQIVGVINAYIALMAEQIGFQALYLSGAGVANSSYGLPDIGVTTLDNVLIDVQRITEATHIPLLVDIDTGWGNQYMIARAIKSMIRAGAAAIQIEDQDFEKRCGHLPGKQVVSKEEMVDRIKAAVDAKTDSNFVIMARTDAFAIEGLDKAIERGIAYLEAGADLLFPEALISLKDFKIYKEHVKAPVLANLTEFGKTPLFTLEELSQNHIDIALYPLSANRAMNYAALTVLKSIKEMGTQKDCLPAMQTRKELYQFLHYEEGL